MTHVASKVKTRARIVGLLREGPRTVDEIARALGLTDNAIRMHLEALVGTGVVRQVGVRRSGTAGKPAMLYEVTPDAEAGYSKVYAPALACLVGTLADHLSEPELENVLRETGRRMAGAPEPQGALRERVEQASALFSQLGALTTVEPNGNGVHLRGAACPLAAAVAVNPLVCHAVEELVAALTGAAARQHCQHHPRPACRFLIEE